MHPEPVGTDRRPQVLVVDDEANLRRVLSAQLSRDGFEVHSAANGRDGLSILREHHIDLVITDLRMPEMDGMGLLREAISLDSELPIIMITAHGTVDNAVEALKTGAFDYITKPFDQSEVRSVVRKALETRKLAPSRADKVLEPAQVVSNYGIIGQSQAALALKDALDLVAQNTEPVLITGEGGTGKELVARALHQFSERLDQPFIKVNCAAIQRDLFESELFGYERGSFEGALSSKPGRLELALGGTLLLDEADHVPVAVQKQLSAALNQGSFERLGGVRRIKVDARLILTSNSDLSRLSDPSLFEPALLNLLRKCAVRVPPLRERMSDVLPLCQHFIGKYNELLNKGVSGVSDAAAHTLLTYPWPGNQRELENAIEHAVLFCDTEDIQPQDLPPELSHPRGDGGEERRGLRAQVKAVTSRLERDLIQRALKQTQGNVTHTARLLKISRKGLQLKMKELGLREREDREG